MELQVQNLSGGNEAATINVNDTVFARAFNETLVHQIVTAYLAGGRAGTRAQKNRAAVSGGGAKPWRQKGTGRARAGTIRSPLWRTGGVTFAAKPQDHSQKVNKKMYRAAMRAIFSELHRQERFTVVDQLKLEEPKTKLMLGLLERLGVSNNVLLISDDIDVNLFLGSRNLPMIQVVDVDGIDPVSLIRYDRVVITVEALKRVGEWLE